MKTQDFSSAWDAVLRWQARLEDGCIKGTVPDEFPRARTTVNCEGPNNEALRRFENAWIKQEKPEAFAGLTARELAKPIAGHPLSHALMLINYGFYPAPEYLLAIAEFFKTYMDAKGAITLEEAFFGKPKRKSGNFSARSAKDFKDLRNGFEILVHMKHGKSLEDSAEMVAEEHGGNSETILRVFRQRWRAAK